MRFLRWKGCTGKRLKNCWDDYNNKALAGSFYRGFYYSA
jgi:hypothetical protein